MPQAQMNCEAETSNVSIDEKSSEVEDGRFEGIFDIISASPKICALSIRLAVMSMKASSFLSGYKLGVFRPPKMLP